MSPKGKAEEEGVSVKRVSVDGADILYQLDEPVPYSISGLNARPKVSSFDDGQLGFDAQILKNLRKANYKKPTDIQCYGMPQLVAKLDIMGCANTGSGKTATFLLPFINFILREKRNLPAKSIKERCSYPAALILVPTRELAEQIANDAIKFAENLPAVRIRAVYGGTNFGEDLSTFKSQNINMIVATPGRMLHLLEETDVVDLSFVKYVVVDEADKMFDRGFFHHIGVIMNYMPSKEKRVTAIFSATFPRQIQYFAEKQLRKDSIRVVVGMIGGAAPKIKQKIKLVSLLEKRSQLMECIRSEEVDGNKVLVFCNRIETVVLLEHFLLTRGLKPATLHSELEQFSRDQALNEFNTGEKKILIATSVAARGLNIEGTVIVINYDIPLDASDYIVRIGRARVDPSSIVEGESKKARAISFFDEDTDDELVPHLVQALKSTKQRVPSFLAKFIDARKEIEESEEYMIANEDLRNKMMQKVRTRRCVEYYADDELW